VENAARVGIYGTVDELARAGRSDLSYVSRVLRLTLLAPEPVDAVLRARQHGGGAGCVAEAAGLKQGRGPTLDGKTLADMIYGERNAEEADLGRGR
jgi:hypothetical protein